MAHLMRPINVVAKKSEFFRQLQAVPVLGDIARRPSAPLSATLYLMRLRRRRLKIPLPTLKRKIEISTGPNDSKLVKIIIDDD